MESDLPTNIELTRAEAVVLFDWLHRMEFDRQSVTTDDAEQVALWALSAALERVLVEPFEDDYSELLEQARHHLRGNA